MNTEQSPAFDAIVEAERFQDHDGEGSSFTFFI